MTETSNPAPSEIALFEAIRFNDSGLVPAIVQDGETRDVLMMAWMDESAIRNTLRSGQTHFYSRSRRASWHKGATSGHVQYVESIHVDCDGDTLLILVRQIGGACHEGYRSCFFRRWDEREGWRTIAVKSFDPAAVYQGRDGPAR
jgi:phosphoribosyl-AMP cyclohydrolase